MFRLNVSQKGELLKHERIHFGLYRYAPSRVVYKGNRVYLQRSVGDCSLIEMKIREPDTDGVLKAEVSKLKTDFKYSDMALLENGWFIFVKGHTKLVVSSQFYPEGSSEKERFQLSKEFPQVHLV